MAEVTTLLLGLSGAFFTLLAAIGLARLPDIYTRMQATTKASSLGIGWIMLAVAVHFGTFDVAVRALLLVAFVFLTQPIAAHIIARAAYMRGDPLWQGTVVDDLEHRIDVKTQEVAPWRPPVELPPRPTPPEDPEVGT